MLVASATFLLASSGFIAIYVLLLSHRIAGPMYGIAQTLKAVKEGDWDQRCLLRKHDLLWPLSDDVNKFLEWMQKEHGDKLSSGTTETATADAPELSSAGRAGTHLVGCSSSTAR